MRVEFKIRDTSAIAQLSAEFTNHTNELKDASTQLRIARAKSNIQITRNNNMKKGA